TPPVSTVTPPVSTVTGWQPGQDAEPGRAVPEGGTPHAVDQVAPGRFGASEPRKYVLHELGVTVPGAHTGPGRVAPVRKKFGAQAGGTRRVGSNRDDEAAGRGLFRGKEERRIPRATCQVVEADK
ncbi:MAG: hypothetical protein L7T26_03730, partial [Pseudomonadales bacterium]|nr:hypothetical protein [Pseudomonadales bacterium]